MLWATASRWSKMGTCAVIVPFHWETTCITVWCLLEHCFDESYGMGCGRLAAVRRVRWEAGWRHRPLGHGAAWGWTEKEGFTVTGPSAKYKCWQSTGSQINILTWLESLSFLLWLPCPEMWPRAQGSSNRDTVLSFNLLLLFIHSFPCLVASAFHLFLKMFLSLSPGFDPLCLLHSNLPNTQYLIQLTSCHQYGVPAAGSSNSKPNPIIWGKISRVTCPK